MRVRIKCLVLLASTLSVAHAARGAEAADAVETGVFASGVPAVAASGGYVDGTVHWARFALKSTDGDGELESVKQRPLARCLLTHGYSIGLNELQHALSRPFGDGMTYIEAFGNLYFGRALIEALLRDVCDDVYVAMQESDATSLMEMTVRTERFLRDQICVEGRCALFGHSKGGAVAFNIARRCMEERSELGRNGCLRLAKVYAASATVQGNALTALMYGVKLLSERMGDAASDPSVDTYRATLEHLMHITVEATDAPPREWDLFGDHEPGWRNPAWFDLSPIAPVEDGRPVFEVNDVVLQRRGWFRGSFAASNGDYVFQGSPDERIGCGTPTPRPSAMLDFIFWSRQASVYRAMDEQLATIHTPAGRRIFEVGANAMVRYARRLYGEQVANDLRSRLDWQDFQHSDGMVEQASALGSCLKGLASPSKAVLSCARLRRVNHAATNGTAAEAVSDIVARLAE